MKVKFRKILSIILLLLLAGGMLVGCKKQEKKIFQSMEDFREAKIGIMTGSTFDLLVNEYFPNAKKYYCNNIADWSLNLKQGKVDGTLMDMAFYTPFRWEGDDVGYIKMDMPDTKYGIAFSDTAKSEILKSQMDEFIRSRTESGWMAEQESKWFGASEPDVNIDFSTLAGGNGTLKVATAAESKPFNYLKNGKFYGYDAEFIYTFAEAYGYALDIEIVGFSALIPGLEAKHYDIAISSIMIVDERKEAVLFSEPYFSSPIVMGVLTENLPRVNGGPTALSDLSNSTIGVLTGTVYDAYAKELLPNAERRYYTMLPDMILAISQGKIEGFIAEMSYVTAARWDGAKIKPLDKPIDESQAGFITSKTSEGATIRAQMNEFIISARESGLLNRLSDKWFSDTEPTEFFDPNSLTGERGTIKVAVSPDLKPVCYMKNGIVTGYDVEVLLHFAKEYGYKIEFEIMNFDAVLMSVANGICQIGSGAITITEERAESVDFTESYMTNSVVMVVSEENLSNSNTNFLSDIKESFDKTFVREDRWKLIVHGIGVTMLISVCAILLGSLFGFGVYMLGRSDVKPIASIVKGFCKVYSRIVAGTPAVVILMILFYVIFGNMRDISGELVAIVGFALTFGAFVYDHMTVSVGSVDPGQTEAAYALGYNKNQTFFRIVFPQAMKIFMPSYCAQAVETIKATAVVGYIAVNDLTKMGDIIRSNTYEAFFPLIATALIYFVLTWIISSLLGLIKLRFEPKRRKSENILKGVKSVDSN